MTDIILDIETIPDLEFGRQHMNLDGLRMRTLFVL